MRIRPAIRRDGFRARGVFFAASWNKGVGPEGPPTAAAAGRRFPTGTLGRGPVPICVFG
ncbi:DUF6053 domain-containing protein [Lysobacter enzymogenes]|uniref:DUF6053 domain-containing protein n=1 Tax=Lysobacter enzymogenes TaxID=69 RepID=UPI003D1898D0